MALPLHQRTIALAESRQLEELAEMLEKEGAGTLRCPLVSILDAPDPAPVLSWLGDLIAGRFDYVLLFTGEGLRRLLGFAERAGIRPDVIKKPERSRAAPSRCGPCGRSAWVLPWLPKCPLPMG